MTAYDQALMFEDNDAITSSRASTFTIPLGNLSSGNAERDIGGAGDGNRLFLEIKVKTTFTSTGSSTLVGALQTDDADTFGSATTLLTTPTIAKATLVAGYRARFPLPPGAYEDYLRVNWTVGTADFTSGNLDCWIGDGLGRFVAVDQAAVVV